MPRAYGPAPANSTRGRGPVGVGRGGPGLVELFFALGDDAVEGLNHPLGAGDGVVERGAAGDVLEGVGLAQLGEVPLRLILEVKERAQQHLGPVAGGGGLQQHLVLDRAHRNTPTVPPAMQGRRLSQIRPPGQALQARVISGTCRRMAARTASRSGEARTAARSAIMRSAPLTGSAPAQALMPGWGVGRRF